MLDMDTEVYKIWPCFQEADLFEGKRKALFPKGSYFDGERYMLGESTHF